MMLTAVIGILVSFTRTPVQPYTAGGNNNTAGGNNNTAGSNNNTAGGNNNTAGGNNNTAGGNNNTAGGNNNTAGGNNNTAGGNNNTAGVIGVSINEIGPLDIQNNRPFTDTAAILNLLNLKSIMGCPGGTRSVFSPLFRQTENFTVYFSGKRRSLLHPNTAQRSFFPIAIFF